MDVAWTMELPLEATPQTAPEEARAVAASLKGDRDAFTELVRQHQRRVFRLAGRFFRHAEDVEEVAQETFLTAWKKLATYKAKAPFENWLTRVCLNCCYERLRKRRTAEHPLNPVAEPAARAADPAVALEVERLLQTLQPQDRFILLLLDGEGWSVAEIADRLGWSKANVKVRAHRARKKLRQLLERGQES
jgi:RNA polymerase sigma-70 factor (ECF subfamily)